LDAGAVGDPEYVLEGFLEGELLGGSVYLIEGRYLPDREELLGGAACGASGRRRAVLLSFLSPPACAAGQPPSAIDASSIREEGLKVVAARLMDELSSGGAVFADSAELLRSSVGDEREYLNLLYTLRRISMLGRGTLVIASGGGPEEVIADFVFEVGPLDVHGRRFRVISASSPYTPSGRGKFLLTSDRRIVKPPVDAARGRMELGELEGLISSMRPDSSLEVYVDHDVPEHLVEGFLDGLASALKDAGIKASIYPDDSKDVGEDAGELLMLGKSEGAVSIHVGCPGCPRGRSDYLVRITSIGGVPVLFFERPWSAAYYVDGLSLRRID